MKAVHIEWDVDCEEDKALLPTEIKLPDGMEDEEEISDYLSEVTGFCHKGFCLAEANTHSAINLKTPVGIGRGGVYKMTTVLSEQIRNADKKAAVQFSDRTPVYLFQENRSGNRMGKPGDVCNVYYVSWFQFYSLGPDLIPQDEGFSLNFKDPSTHKPVPGGNSISEVDVLESFRKKNPERSVVLLEIEPFKGDLKDKMNMALQKFKEDGHALLTLPPLVTQADRQGQSTKTATKTQVYTQKDR